jgi:F0F1-type ATP synthase delta subunit
VLPDLEYEPKSAVGQVAIKIFYSASVLKLDLNLVESEFAALGQILKDAEARQFLIDGPSLYEAVEYEASLREYINKSEFSAGTKQIILGLYEDGDFPKLEGAIASFAKIMRSFRNEHSGVITTTYPLTKSELAFYSKTLAAEHFGAGTKAATLDLTNNVDPSLIGGYVLNLDGGEIKIDKSYASEIASVKALEGRAVDSLRQVDKMFAVRFR